MFHGWLERVTDRLLLTPQSPLSLFPPPALPCIHPSIPDHTADPPNLHSPMLHCRTARTSRSTTRPRCTTSASRSSATRWRATRRYVPQSLPAWIGGQGRGGQ